jgi:hypothetical protein
MTLKYVQPKVNCCLAVNTLSQWQVDFINTCPDIAWWDEDRVEFQDKSWDHLYFSELDEDVTAVQHLESDSDVMVTFNDIFIEE